MRWHALALAVLVVLAGCGGGGGEADDGPTVVRAAPATVDEAARSATGYDLVARSNRTTNTTLTLSIQGDVELNPTFAVRATTERATYERQTADGTAAVGVVSVPGVKPSEALAEPRDPLADRGVAALATNATGYVVRDPRPAANGTVRLFGNGTTLRRYEATGRADGGPARPVTVAVARARHGGDFVRVVAVVPRGTEEGDRVARLVAGVRHEKES